MAKFRVEYEVTYRGHVIVEASTSEESIEIFDDCLCDASNAFDVPQARDEPDLDVIGSEPADLLAETELR